MLTGHLEGRFLKMLVAISGARRILEIGTFTGYSAHVDGRGAAGRRSARSPARSTSATPRSRVEHIADSPYADKIEVRVGPALDTIASLDGAFDMVFIDADKPAYRAYYEAVLPRLSERGFICIDNVLWSWTVLDSGDNRRVDRRASRAERLDRE